MAKPEDCQRTWDTDAMGACTTHLEGLSADASTIASVSEDVSPAFGTWGVLLGTLCKGDYDFLKDEFLELLAILPDAISAHGNRIQECAEVYEDCEAGAAQALDVIQGEIDH